MAIKEYSKSIEKSKDIMEHFINLLADQGVTHVPIWEPKEGAEEAAEEAEKPMGDKLRRKSSAKGRDLEQGMAENTDPASKLDQDYIQMFLGKLEPMQESRLVQLKTQMAELQKGKAPSDPVVLRFLRARWEFTFSCNNRSLLSGALFLFSFSGTHIQLQLIS